MQKARGHIIMMLPQLVGVRFQVYFTPLNGVLFAFPLRYWFAIGHRLVLSLGRWSSQIPTGFHVPRGTQVPLWPFSGSGTGVSPSVPRLPSRFPCLLADPL